jgi:hypothetical protein
LGWENETGSTNGDDRGKKSIGNWKSAIGNSAGYENAAAGYGFSAVGYDAFFSLSHKIL